MGIRILYDFDTWDAATITSSSEASSDLADDNVIHDFVGKVWRTTGDTAEWIKFDMGAQTSLTCIGLFNFNLTSAATVTLEGNASDSWGAPSYSQALTIVTDSDSNVFKRLVYFPSGFNYRWARITFADAANSDGYIQIGRIAAGAYYEPPRTISEQYKLAMYDPSEGDVVPGRQTTFRTRNRYRRASVEFSYINQTQADKMYTMFDKVGNSSPLVLVLDPTSRPSKDSMYCYMATPLDLVNLLVSQFGVHQLVFEEKTE